MTTWHPAPPSPFADSRVGLLGGSFNPAHEGHLHVSRQALATLRLDEVWWLVAPQNPLKPTEGMAPLAQRVASARAGARDPRIRVTDIEAALHATYTVETQVALRHEFPRQCFVWVMGADNLIQIPRWKDWTQIFNSMPIAVFARPSYSMRAMAGAAAQRYARFRLPETAAGRLASTAPPAWVFVHARLHPASATAIRAGHDDAIHKQAQAGKAAARKAARPGAAKRVGASAKGRKE
ncbi:MAG: nicotinate-nucleotide adenylyltransferase [Pseudomonadota bacterium]